MSGETGVADAPGDGSGVKVVPIGPPPTDEPVTAPVQEAPGSKENGTDQVEEDEEEEESAPEEYVFEDHVREIVMTLIERARPHLGRAARSLPGGTLALASLIMSSWRLWASIGLLAVMVAMLLAVGFVPGLWFDRAVASFGLLPFIQ